MFLVDVDIFFKSAHHFLHTRYGGFEM